MKRPEVWVAAAVAFCVSLAVVLALPRISGWGDELGLGADDGLLQAGLSLFAPLSKADDLSGEGANGPEFCVPDLVAFENTHELEARGLANEAPNPADRAPEQVAQFSETVVLTPTRMNSYSLTELPEHFVGFLAQRGSFMSDMFGRVGDIEVLSTFALNDRTIARRTLSDSILKGAGPIQGIFHVDYGVSGKILGHWQGYTNSDGDLQGCFEFAPTPIDGRSIAGIGTFTQDFKPNDTAIVTWDFQGLYRSPGHLTGR